MITLENIIEMQKSYGVTQTQEMINNGQCWLMEGSVGRFAADCLRIGVCVLPEDRKRDYYGNTVPSRNDIKAGSNGSLENAQEFWQKVEDGDFECEEFLLSSFCKETGETVETDGE
jgi:hypothetical protein